MKHDFRGYPSGDYRFFAFDPNGEGTLFFRTARERDIYAEEVIDDYRDEDGWSDDVTSICVGEVTGISTAVDVVKKPPAEDLDESGFDSEGRHWGDFDMICRYEIGPLPLTDDEKSGASNPWMGAGPDPRR
jgi:hypothetical protein